MSGDTPLWPFSRSDSALRVTPRASAAAVTVRPSGFRQSSRMISPGWAGSNISTAASLLVIIDQVDIDGIGPVELEHEPPVPRHPHRPLSRTIAEQRMQPVAGLVQVRGT